MPDVPKVPDRDREEEIIVEVPAPSAGEVQPDMLISTERKGGIVRGEPLAERHGMTTEADRFREI